MQRDYKVGLVAYDILASQYVYRKIVLHELNKFKPLISKSKRVSILMRGGV